MSDTLKHECGVSLLRLRKPLDYYVRKYGTQAFGFQKLALLLEKQHNRGQDGAGIACVNLDPAPGQPCYTVEKSVASNPLADLLERIGKKINNGCDLYSGELLLGHLRYATFGRHELDACHPFVKDSSRLEKVLLMAGNFNLTNTHSLMQKLMELGYHPSSRADGYVILELLTHYLEKALALQGRNYDLVHVLRQTAEQFDGAFTFCGILGDGTAFALRDPHGIRPGYFYFDDEVAVAASERPAIQAAFNCATAEVQEIQPGQAVIIRRDGSVEFASCLPPQERRSCVFERIYFSRANDADIHHERKKLGHTLIPQVLRAIGKDLDNTFFSYIPNSAQVCFHGLLESMFELGVQCGKSIRFGQIAVKDAKFRTFIADAACRKDFYMHIYDVTYGLVRPGADNLVVLDDSIVRGNTMRNAILPILDRLQPKKVIVASSAPPVKYPDCYGIDMATLQELVAFNALVELLKRDHKMYLLEQAYHRAEEQLKGPDSEMTNCLKDVYQEYSDQEISDAITLLLRPESMNSELEVVFQTCANLRRSCPNYTGDWYFTGDYPTPGGFRVVNQALVNFMEHKDERAY